MSPIRNTNSGEQIDEQVQVTPLSWPLFIIIVSLINSSQKEYRYLPKCSIHQWFDSSLSPLLKHNFQAKIFTQPLHPFGAGPSFLLLLLLHSKNRATYSLSLSLSLSRRTTESRGNNHWSFLVNSLSTITHFADPLTHSHSHAHTWKDSRV